MQRSLKIQTHAALDGNPPVGVTCYVLVYTLHSDFQASAAVTTEN